MATIRQVQPIDKRRSDALAVVRASAAPAEAPRVGNADAGRGGSASSLDPVTRRTNLPKAWTSGLAAFAVCSAILIWAFWTEIAAAVHVWSTSPTFGHGFLIFPITLFLLYRLRHRLAALQPSPAPWAMMPMAGLMLVWLVGNLADIMVIQQLAFLGLWQALFLLVFGWPATRAALFPLAYLYLAVPLGSAAIPALQDVTAQIVVYFLRLTGMPVFLDGYLIQIPSGRFLVAEACSGVRYLIVSLALGILVAYLFFQSWPRRLFFVGLCAVVPILANGVRAYGIIMLAHLSDYTLAVDVDHVVYGFLFLAAVTFVLLGLAAALRDRQDFREPAPARSAATERPLRHRQMIHDLPVQAVCCGASVAMILLVQAWAATATEAPEDLAPALFPPQPGAGWQAVADPALDWTPRVHGSDVTLVSGYRLGDDHVQLYVAYYAYQREGAEAVSDLNTLSGKEWRAQQRTSATIRVAGKEHPYVRMVLSGRNGPHLVWYWYRVGGQNTNSRTLGKLLQLKALMLGGEKSAAVIAIASRVSEDAQQTDALLGNFLSGTLSSDGALVRVGNGEAAAGTTPSP